MADSPAARTVIIGDVHGCLAELEDLLALIDVDPQADDILFIGDLINKGPESPGVIDCFHSLGAQSLLGNHEWRLINQADRRASRGKDWQRLRDDFGKGFDELVDEIRGWQPYVRRERVLAVHAGLVPGRPPEDSSVSDLVNIRTWDGGGRDLQSLKNAPWFDFYRGNGLVVFGHWAALGGLERDLVIGIDTGCVYGNRLTALLLPERRLVSVPARKAYCPIR